MRRATQLWKDGQDYVDDITVVVIFLDRQLIQRNIYTRPELLLIEQKELIEKEIEDKRKQDKVGADEQPQQMARRRKRPNSHSPSLIEETDEKFMELSVKGSLKPPKQN